MVAFERAVLAGVALAGLWCVLGCGSSPLPAAGDGARSGAGGSSGSGGSGGSAGTSGGAGGKGGNTSGSGGMNTCGSFAPCGGYLVGAWRIDSECGLFTSDSEYPECVGSTLSETYTDDAIYTFGADGTVTLTGTVVLTADQVITDACAEAQDGLSAAVLCAGLNAASCSPDGAAGADGSGSDLGFSAMCMLQDSDCQCHIMEGPTPVDDSTTYSVMGNQVTIGTSASDFCVDGDKLTIQGTSSTSGLTQSRFTRR